MPCSRSSRSVHAAARARCSALLASTLCGRELGSTRHERECPSIRLRDWHPCVVLYGLCPTLWNASVMECCRLRECRAGRAPLSVAVLLSADHVLGGVIRACHWPTAHPYNPPRVGAALSNSTLSRILTFAGTRPTRSCSDRRQSTLVVFRDAMKSPY